MLKIKLLNTGMFIDNEYLDLYIDLILNHSCSTRIKGKTHAHHIIPRCYFKHNNIDVDNSKDNIVHLMYSMHILAHWYLYKCVTIRYKYAMLMAIRKLGIKNFDSSKLTLDIDYINLQEEYEKTYAFRHKIYTEMCSKIFKNTCYIHNEFEEKRVPIESVNDFLEDGYVRGRLYQYSEFAKFNNGNATRGKIKLIKEGIIKYIQPCELDNYLNLGGIRDDTDKRTQEQKDYALSKCVEANTGTTLMHKDTINRRFSESEVEDKLKDGGIIGMYVSEDKHKQLSEVHKGNRGSSNYIGIHNDNEYIRKLIPADELDDYMDKGGVRGQKFCNDCTVQKPIKQKVPMKGIHLDSNIKKVPESELHNYLSLGGKLGKLDIKVKETKTTGIHLGTKSTYVDNSILQQKLDEGGELGMYVSEEKHALRSKKAKKNSNTLGFKGMYKDNESKLVPPEEINKYLKDGGRYGQTIKN